MNAKVYALLLLFTAISVGAEDVEEMVGFFRSQSHPETVGYLASSQYNNNNTRAGWRDRIGDDWAWNVVAVAPFFDCNDGTYSLVSDEKAREVVVDCDGADDDGPVRYCSATQDWVFLVERVPACPGHFYTARTSTAGGIFRDGFEDGTTGNWSFSKE